MPAQRAGRRPRRRPWPRAPRRRGRSPTNPSAGGQPRPGDPGRLPGGADDGQARDQDDQRDQPAERRRGDDGQQAPRGHRRRPVPRDEDAPGEAPVDRLGDEDRHRDGAQRQDRRERPPAPRAGRRDRQAGAARRAPRPRSSAMVRASDDDEGRDGQELDGDQAAEQADRRSALGRLPARVRRRSCATAARTMAMATISAQGQTRGHEEHPRSGPRAGRSR